MIAGFVVGAILSLAVIMILYDAMWRRKVRLESSMRIRIYNARETSMTLRDAGIHVIDEHDVKPNPSTGVQRIG